MNANVPMLDEIAGKNTKEVIDVLNETIRQQQAEIEALKAKTLTDEEIWSLMDEIEVLVYGDIKRAMYRMARKVESILNE
jgi:cell division protein FtsB